VTITCWRFQQNEQTRASTRVFYCLSSTPTPTTTASAQFSPRRACRLNVQKITQVHKNQETS